MHGIRYLFLDRDSKFTAQFKSILNDAGITPVRICYQAPNMNAFTERWVLSAKTECLNRMIFFGVRSLQRALDAYCAHYHPERPHQGLGNALITPAPTSDADDEIIASERLGGLLRSYRRAA